MDVSGLTDLFDKALVDWHTYALLMVIALIGGVVWLVYINTQMGGSRTP